MGLVEFVHWGTHHPSFCHHHLCLSVAGHSDSKPHLCWMLLGGLERKQIYENILLRHFQQDNYRRLYDDFFIKIFCDLNYLPPNKLDMSSLLDLWSKLRKAFNSFWKKKATASQVCVWDAYIIRDNRMIREHWKWDNLVTYLQNPSLIGAKPSFLLQSVMAPLWWGW